MSTSGTDKSGIPTGTVTFLFTDIEGSTRLWEEHPQQMAADLRRHDTLLRQAIESHHGYVFKTIGDAFCAAFSHADDALRAAIMTQQTLESEPWGGEPIKVRIGIHSGSAEERDSDYYGPVINRVARLMAIGHGGQTLLSASVMTHIVDDLPGTTKIQDLGEHRLKNLKQPEQVYQLDIEGLTAEFPPLNSLSVFANNLPLQLTEFIGRKKELAQTKQILDRCRLLTIVGPGGIGKSRLALEIAAERIGGFRDGIFFVPLAPVQTADLVPEVIAENIGFSLSSAVSPREQLLRHLADREVLLVLDNMEHIIETADLAGEILQSAPGVKIIATSREKLKLSSETVYMLSGLGSEDWHSLPEALDDDAVRLFVDAARRVRPEYELTEVRLGDVGRIIHLIQGSPLGILLAASWMDMLSPAEIAAEISQSYDFLETELRDLPERQRSARAAFDYSWRLLSAEERHLFAALSLFRGGFTREAAEEVAGATLRRLANLANKSFLSSDPDTGRYAVHELLRQFGEAALMEEGDRYEIVRDAHAHFYAAHVAGQMEAIFRGDHSQILAELDNIRAAWRRAAERRMVVELQQMIWPMSWFYDLRGYHAECVAMTRLVIDALKMPEPAGLQGIVYGSALANYALELEKLEGADSAAPLVREGLEIMRSLGAREDLAWPQLVSGWVFQDVEEFESAALESLGIFEEENNLYGIAFSLLMLSWYYRGQDRFEEARSIIARGLEISRSLGDPEGQATGLRQLGLLNLHLGHYEEARDNFLAEYELWTELGLPRLLGETLSHLGLAHLFGGDITKAEKTFEQSLAVIEQSPGDAHALWPLLGLVQVAMWQSEFGRAHDYLDRAAEVLEGRQDSYDEGRWWQLAGRLALEEGDLQGAAEAFGRALALSEQADRTEYLRVIVEFAHLFQAQNEAPNAARLLGYARVQSGLPAEVTNFRIEPLLSDLASLSEDQEMAELLQEGAELKQGQIALILQADG